MRHDVTPGPDRDPSWRGGGRHDADPLRWQPPGGVSGEVSTGSVTLQAAQFRFYESKFAFSFYNLREEHTNRDQGNDEWTVLDD